MAGTQTDNLLLLDLTTGLSRTPETGGTPDIIETSNDWAWVSGASVVIAGNLTVNGTTFTVHSEAVNIRDNHLYLNADYTVAVAQTGGFVVNVLPTATTDTVAATGFVARAGAANATVSTTGGATFSAGDIIQVDGADNPSNDGLFEVESHAANVLTIRGLGTFANTQDWFTNDFVTDTTVAGGITLVNVNVLRGNSSGDWESYTGATTTGLTYTTITMQGVVDLQEAYIQGNTITTSAGEGNVTFAGTETFVITTSGGIDLDSPFDFDSTIFDVQMTGTNGFSIDGTAASNVTVDAGDLTLSTTTSGSALIDGIDGVEINSSAGALSIGNDADAFAIDIGTGAAARTITMGNVTGATSVNFDAGTGAFTFDSTVDQVTAFATYTNSGTGGDSYSVFVGGVDPTAAAGVAAVVGSIYHRDVANAGTSGEMYIKTGAAATAWTVVGTGAGNSLQLSYVAGNTIVTDAVNGSLDVSGTEAISLDASSASNFTVDAASLTLSTTTSGTLLLDGVALVDMNAGAGMDIDVTGTFDMLSTGAFSIDGTGVSNVTATSGNLTVSTATSGDLLLSSAAEVDVTAATTVDINAGTTVTVDTADLADASGNDITITAGSSTAGTADGASITLAPGDGFTTGVHGSVDITGAFDADEIMLGLTGSGGGGNSDLYAGSTVPSHTATAGSVFFFNDGTTAATGGRAYIQVDANGAGDDGSTWEQIATGDTTETLQEAYVAGNTITTSAAEGDFDVSGTEAISLDAGAASNFSVAAASLTLETTTSGTIDINSADDITVTFEAANSTAMVIDDGANTYMTFDSTAASPSVDMGQFVDIVASGAGLTLTAGEALTVGDIVTIEATTGDAILADSNTGTTLDGLAVGIVAFTAADTTPVKVFTVAGSLVAMSFAAAPAAASNGSPVFVSATAGEATLTAPTGSGNVIYLLGILQGADGADTSPLVLFQPQFIAVRP